MFALESGSSAWTVISMIGVGVGYWCWLPLGFYDWLVASRRWGVSIGILESRLEWTIMTYTL